MYACTLVISVRELWLPPLRAPHVHTDTYVLFRKHGHARSRRSPRVSGDDGGRVYAKLRGLRRPRREKTEKNSEGRRAGGKKIVRAITHPLDARKSGIPLASQTSFLSHGGSEFFMRNELISFLRLKKPRRCASSWTCKKRRIKSREINANTFYVLRKHASYARLACFLRKLSGSFFVGSRASCTCLNVPSSRHMWCGFFSTEICGIQTQRFFYYIICRLVIQYF